MKHFLKGMLLAVLVILVAAAIATLIDGHLDKPRYIPSVPHPVSQDTANTISSFAHLSLVPVGSAKPLWRYLTDSLQAENRKIDAIELEVPRDSAIIARYNRNIDLYLQILWYQRRVNNVAIAADKRALERLRNK